MDKLLKGIVKFKESDYQNHKELFTSLSSQQKPHTLFITCSDSRIVPVMITQTLPGELFIVRNIANIVPPYRIADEYLATTAAIEYAVQVLKIENIIICGHSNCGGCALLHNKKSNTVKIPITSKWMQLADPVKKMVEDVLPHGNISEKAWFTEQINVLEQMKHLLTYPYIKEKYKDNLISIRGWHYIIETGEIFEYNSLKQEFELMN